MPKTFNKEEQIQSIVECISEQIPEPKGKTCLDVGTRDGVLPNMLVETGFTVTAIDIKPMPSHTVNSGFEFIQIPFEYFNIYTPQRHFDVVVSLNVLPFLVDKRYTLQKFIDIGDLQFFNVWGLNHAWAKKAVLTYTPDEIKELKQQIQKTHEILLFQEDDYETPTIARPEELTRWHEYRFLIKRK